MSQWKTDGYDVWPLDDLKEHKLGTTECWCKPIIDELLIVHNSMDKRELYETNILKTN